ncbi:MAG: TIGR04283 family arsenosugar biosynthesis glycosyltransferase [Firmicutes bacterium]|nr:TIGR04283 family arsenosugar biosynthesis glycosyltransferase [Bacillota bacterium]MBR3706517.1 TIGR04283 family arsenosugar biosynthesis glycosyltransferase [Bacillota bacterium]
MKLSVIIPIYNEESTIGKLIPQLENVKDQAEIIFVDGGSSDRTLEMIPEGYTVIRSGKGRARQMNTGAENSTGDVLFFLHCDSLLPEDFPAQIAEVMAVSDIGCFGMRFDEPDLFLLSCQRDSHKRILKKNIAFGDQGIFLKRDLFFKLGCFPEIPIMEDYDFSKKVRAAGYRYVTTRDRIVTSARRFKEGGSLRTMYRMVWLRRKYDKGMDINQVARIYRDIR